MIPKKTIIKDLVKKQLLLRDKGTCWDCGSTNREVKYMYGVTNVSGEEEINNETWCCFECYKEKMQGIQMLNINHSWNPHMVFDAEENCYWEVKPDGEVVKVEE